MKITKANPKQTEEIAKLNKQFDTAFEDRNLEVPIPKYSTLEWVLEEIEEGNQYIIKDKKDVVGAMCLYMETEEFPSDTAYIESIAVKKNKHHGGFGRKLIEFAKRKSERSGKAVLRVDSFCVYGVKDFYLKCGFELEKELGDYYGTEYYRFFMKL